MRKLIVVTGANSGLGMEIARQALAGSSTDPVLATTRSERQYLEPAERLTLLPGADLATEAGCQALSRAVDAKECECVVLAHCAGHFPQPVPLRESTLAEARQSISANYLTLVGALGVLLPKMRGLGAGRIVAFTSHTTADSFPYMGLFNAGKNAVESLIRTTAYEGARHGIAANALAIATLSTPAEFKLKPRDDHANWLDTKDVAAVALEVLSLSALVNGNIIHCWRHSGSFFGMSYLERNSLPDEY